MVDDELADILEELSWDVVKHIMFAPYRERWYVLLRELEQWGPWP